MKKDNLFQTNSMKLFFMLSLYFLNVLVLYSISSLLNINHILGLIEIVSLIIPIVYISTKLKGKSLIVIISLFLFLTVLLPYISTKTYDLTVDGNTYHKSAIGFIKNGWNPYYETMNDFQKTNNNVVKISDESRINLWVEHYPKASWIIAATIYNMTGDIESGKAITIILSIMLLIISYNILRKIIDKKTSIVFSLLLTLNPIILSQIFSYYVDGIVGICFLIELLLLFSINPTKKIDKLTLISLISIITILTNLKFTGLMISGVIALIFYIYWLIKYKKKVFKNITKIFVIVYVIALFLVGSNSYIKNLIDHKNPLYPIIGKDKVDIITTMQPKSFKHKNDIEKFAISIFSETENVTYDKGNPDLKLPIEISEKEIDELEAPDVRIGGFGPLFALSLILSIIMFIIGLVLLIKNEKKNLKYVIITLLSIFIPMILVGESWWARYIPWFYYLIILNLLLVVYCYKYVKHKKIILGLSLLPLITILGNILIFIKVINKELDYFKYMRNDLIDMKYSDNLVLRTTNPVAYGHLYNLKDKGINYTYKENIEKDDIIYKCCYKFEEEKDE